MRNKTHGIHPETHSASLELKIPKTKEGIHVQDLVIIKSTFSPTTN